MRKASRNQRGVAAIEFALVLPLLMALLIGMMEFSRAWSASASVGQAARVAARSYAIHSDPDLAIQEAISASVEFPLTADNIVIQPTPGCAAGQTADVEITYQMPYLTGMFGNTITITGQGMYPCQG